jgi:putative tryptophan/tyrosine transport system substrate-binding protein
MSSVRRREFITLLGGAAAWPLAARGQPHRLRRTPRIGILNYAAAHDELVSSFRDGLGELGYREGQNVEIIYRWGAGAFDRLPALAAELLAAEVDVILAVGPAVRAAKLATTTVPIVIAFSGDPVGNGVVTNLAHPGGNITGFSYMSTDLAAKRVELLNQALVNNRRIGVLYNSDEPATELEMRETEAAARAIGVKLEPLLSRRTEDLEQAFTAAAAAKAGAMLVFTHGFAVLNGRHIVELAAQRRSDDSRQQCGFSQLVPDVQERGALVRG